jgi:hypothetical protein
MTTEILINTNFDHYDCEYLESFEKFGDFSFLPYKYNFSFSNAFYILNVDSFGMSVFKDPNWVDFLFKCYDNILFKIDFNILVQSLEYINVNGWTTWVSRIKRRNVIHI